MTFAEALAAIGGATMLLAGIRVIFGSGKVVRGQEELAKSFSDHRSEYRSDTQKINGKLDEHGDRILTLELLNGLNGERRHILRRTDDQHLRDGRKMVNGEDL